MVHKDVDRSGVCEIIKGKVYFAILQRPEDLKGSWLPRPALCFSIDNELIYEPFFQDFGPLNLACTYRFCWKLHGLLQDAEAHGRCVCYCTSHDPKKKPNAAVLLGAYLVLFESWEADSAYSPLATFEPYISYRDPTCGISTYHLTVLDCIRAVAKGKKVGWINFNTFNLEEYEYFEQVENGDLNWMVPNKLVAFSGPAPRRSQMYGYRSLVPEDYIEYFKRVGVVSVIRLNKRLYDRRRFTDQGINHYDLYFPDGSCPPERIVQRFLEIVEETSGAIAVHCKAGLGRTGVLIGCYIMKHYRFTANEALGYLRLVRPGSVIGPQQHFLRDMQSRMWKAGDGMRRHRNDGNRSRQQSNNSTTITNPPLVTLWNNASPWSQSRGSLFSTKSSSTTSMSKRVSPERVSSDWGSATSVKTGTRQLLWDQQQQQQNFPKFRRESSSRGEEATEVEYNKGKIGGIEGAVGGLSMMNSTADPLKQLRKASVNEEADATSLISHNDTITDNGGILRNAKCCVTSQPVDPVCTHRTINAAGQPRKVALPLSGTSSSSQQQAVASSIKTRECSPLRSRRSAVSPLRNSSSHYNY